jgi:hypothetical protein
MYVRPEGLRTIARRTPDERPRRPTQGMTAAALRATKYATDAGGRFLVPPANRITGGVRL